VAISAAGIIMQSCSAFATDAGATGRCPRPGQMGSAAFICQLDHILEPQNLIDDANQFRLDSVPECKTSFENPQTPDSIKNGADHPAQCLQL
jgi:hypothetical protein